MGAVLCLAVVCAYVRIFNSTWSRRQLSAFYISVSIGNLGMFGAALEDDILPIRRAVSSGMLLGAHEFALIFYNIIKAALICHLFACTYFSCLYVCHPPHLNAPRVWCTGSSRAFRYFHFTHLLSLNFMAARGFGLLLVVLAGHNVKRSLGLCTGLMMVEHSFSLFSPTRNQISREGLHLMGKLDISQLVVFLCSFSYVRYFLESMMLWEPDQADQVGRNFMLSYYGYHEGRDAACSTTIFGLTLGGGIVRFLLFALINGNTFNASYDAPALIIFLVRGSRRFPGTNCAFGAAGQNL
jgi:hypothetical protein